MGGCQYLQFVFHVQHLKHLHVILQQTLHLYQNLHLMLHFLHYTYITWSCNMEIPHIKFKFASLKPIPSVSDKPSKYCISDNMSLFLLLLLLLLYLSLHPCSARPFGVVDIETAVTGVQLPHKNIEPSRAEGLKVQEPRGARIDRRMILTSWGGANTIQEKNSQTLGKENEDDKGYSVLLPSPEKDLHETSESEDQKRKARSIMESPTANAEETVDSKENKTGEDIVVMDYAQPHRKPPIHNREP